MERREPAVVALGMFDGMHIGHRALIRHASDLAHALGVRTVVDTFSNHPSEVLGGSVRMLSSADTRREQMLLAGADEVRMRTFTREYAAWSPERFVQEELRLWDVRAFVVGFNYSFGSKGAGTPETLCLLGKQYDFAVETVQPVLYRGAPVSSSRIRAALEAGDVAAAADMLGRKYALAGDVVANRRIGRRIGFPTANILPPANRVLPMAGVYATIVQTDAGRYKAMTNIGTNPTVGGKQLSIESHLLDFNGDLYGKPITVRFCFRIRDEHRFSDVEALRQQLLQDVEVVRVRIKLPCGSMDAAENA